MTFRVDPCPGERGVGLSYSSGLAYFFLEHRLCFSAEDKNVQTGYTSQPEGKSRMRRGRLIKLQN